MTEHDDKIRLDKWLWAARFYKTRAIAKQMIEGGKVHYNGQRTKCSRHVEIGAEIQVRQGFEEKTVVVKALSDQRRGAPEAQKLYQETDKSLKLREQHAAERKVNGCSLNPRHRPNKKERRQIVSFKDQVG
ncbi:ribosome-associated heat shock protein Hsp15 [Neptuniibacter sp. CAU 1671]|uniref:ribosome-associated heat shock protein Hsp15 n=1 Tax=Neptuniibacter sp. CAU 1671 TaxID=3032593 RepID=UPI0023DC1BE2|nr:ribosome-associated heat shock protein Hsp15 [Neptuniibacter sp. CAU 1671]MDF2182625.1 ribosome-associated heat shock protein Hsp15 [Neptuniibacter sp. CAU 1671]